MASATQLVRIDWLDPFEAGRVGPTLLDPDGERSSPSRPPILEQGELAPGLVDPEYAPARGTPVEYSGQCADLAQPGDSPRECRLRRPVRRDSGETSEPKPFLEQVQEVAVVLPEVDPEIRMPLRCGPEMRLGSDEPGEEVAQLSIAYGNLGRAANVERPPCARSRTDRASCQAADADRGPRSSSGSRPAAARSRWSAAWMSVALVRVGAFRRPTTGTGRPAAACRRRAGAQRG
jgi:hypothetical protein